MRRICLVYILWRCICGTNELTSSSHATHLDTARFLSLVPLCIIPTLLRVPSQFSRGLLQACRTGATLKRVLVEAVIQRACRTLIHMTSLCWGHKAMLESRRFVPLTYSIYETACSSLRVTGGGCYPTPLTGVGSHYSGSAPHKHAAVMGLLDVEPLGSVLSTWAYHNLGFLGVTCEQT